MIRFEMVAQSDNTGTRNGCYTVVDVGAMAYNTTNKQRNPPLKIVTNEVKCATETDEQRDLAESFIHVDWTSPTWPFAIRARLPTVRKKRPPHAPGAS